MGVGLERKENNNNNFVLIITRVSDAKCILVTSMMSPF